MSIFVASGYSSRQGLRQRRERLGGSLVKLFLTRRIVEMSMRGKHYYKMDMAVMWNWKMNETLVQGQR